MDGIGLYILSLCCYIINKHMSMCVMVYADVYAVVCELSLRLLQVSAYAD